MILHSHVQAVQVFRPHRHTCIKLKPPSGRVELKTQKMRSYTHLSMLWGTNPRKNLSGYQDRSSNSTATRGDRCVFKTQTLFDEETKNLSYLLIDKTFLSNTLIKQTMCREIHLKSTPLRETRVYRQLFSSPFFVLYIFPMGKLKIN